MRKLFERLGIADVNAFVKRFQNVVCKFVWGCGGNNEYFPLCLIGVHIFKSGIDCYGCMGIYNAQVAIGFEESINCDEANDWTDYFFQYYRSGYSAVDSARRAADDCGNDNGIDSYRVVTQ